jgi:hypothetical protein
MHYGLFEDVSQIAGQYNVGAKYKIFAVINEFKITDKHDETALMNLITAPTLNFNDKFARIERGVANYTRPASSTNETPKVKPSRRYSFHVPSDKYSHDKCKKDPKLMQKRKEYFDYLLDEVMVKGADDIYTYLMEYDLSNWDPESPPQSEDYEELEDENKSIARRFYDEWDWTVRGTGGLHGTEICEPVPIRVIIEQFLAWKQLRYPHNRQDFSDRYFISELKRTEDVVITRPRGTNLYYSKTIDGKREDFHEQNKDKD